MSRWAAIAVVVLASCATVPPAPIADPTNVAKDASALVEPGLKDACLRYDAGLRDRRTVLSCGKWMFFFETFGTRGVPASIPRMLLDAFGDEVGAGFEKLGLIEDPRSPDHLPFGIVGSGLTGLTPALGFSCASCHVARLDDGRLVVGAPNHRYEYGKHMVMMTVFPFAATGAKGHDPDAVAIVQPLVDKLKADPKLWAKLGPALMSAIGSFKNPKLRPETEHMYATWPPGTLDFVLQPLATDDDVEIVGKIPALFDLPRPRTNDKRTLVHGKYGWTGNASSLFSFMRGFIALGGGHEKLWTDRKLYPLVEYLYSLRAPENPSPASPIDIAAGRALFRDKSCRGCHDGPDLGGKRLFTFDEVGTDATLTRWLDSKGKGKPCCGIKLADPLTHAVKAPRLVGLWLQRRFLHNGALSSLEQLFCLAPRPTNVAPLGAEGHRQTCDGLSEPEKRALIAYLRSI